MRYQLITTSQTTIISGSANGQTKEVNMRDAIFSAKLYKLQELREIDESAYGRAIWSLGHQCGIYLSAEECEAIAAKSGYEFTRNGKLFDGEGLHEVSNVTDAVSILTAFECYKNGTINASRFIAWMDAIANDVVNGHKNAKAN
jgi:hypothetical protein